MGLPEKKHLIHQLHQLGICISYDYVLELDEWIDKSACEYFDDQEGSHKIISCLSA